MRVFVDTSAVLALMWTSDDHHEDALATWRRLSSRHARPVTTDLVLAETVALTRSRAGYELSVRAAERIMSEAFELVFVDRDLLADAWSIYRKYSDHPLSLCDCASVAVMRRSRIALAFAYDADFGRLGVRCATPTG